MRALLLLSLTGCWKSYSDLPSLDFTEVPYQISGLEATDAVIDGFTSDLVCPDGDNARFFAVYKQGLTGSAPIALVFHSDAFDYVLDPDPSAPLDGDHYYLDSRLSSSWSVSKVWETLGMDYPDALDASEVNTGALPAALTDAGFVSIYPANCWGDLWHNWPDNIPNDTTTEGFQRAGLEMASDMVDIFLDASRATQLSFSLPVQTDSNQMYLVGLGEGGRAIPELLSLNATPPMAGALIDSSPDDLSTYTADPQTYSAEIEGLSRIFLPENLDGISAYSMAGLGADALPPRTLYLWSSVDPRLPAGTGAAGADAVEIYGGLAYDTEENAHVVTNGDATTAKAVVDYLQNGTDPGFGQ